MKLYIDTSSNKKTIVKLGDKILERDSSVWYSQVVLLMIDELLKLQGRTLQDITEIEVVKTGDSFTGLRVGAAIGNALGYALNVPVNCKKIHNLDLVLPDYDL